MAQRQEMFSWLDKKSLGDQDENKKTLSNQIATDDNDGAVVLEDSINEFILNYDFTYNNQAELINTYREVANYNEVDFAIEDIVNEAVTFGDSDSNAVELDLSSIDDEILSEKVKEFVYESWDKINNLLDLNTTIHRRFKSFYIDGRLSYQKVIDKASVSNNGLLNIIQLDPRFVTKFRNVEYDKANHTIQAVDEYFIYNENIAETNPSDQKTKQNKNSNFKEALKLNKESITYITSGITDSNSGYATSWLHKAVKPANQLRMMENALVVYRITRAPERRVFYVDTSGMTKTKAEQYLKNLKSNYRNRMSYDPDSGSFKDSRHLMTMQEDYWMPRNASTGKGTEVDTLPGGCFAMDTKVSLLDGRERSIAEIRDEMETGKELWTYSVNPETGKVAAGLISWAGVTQKSAEVMKLTLDNGEEIICTPDHKFPVYGKGFVRADKLLENESMMPLYRKNEQISKYKKLDYEQYFDNESKKWVYTHRMVANELKGSKVKNFVYESNDDGVYDVRHHVDFDRYNNDPSNLVFMGWNDHQKLHTDNGFSRESILLGTQAAKERLVDMKECDPELYEDHCSKIAERTKDMWSNLSEADKNEITQKMSKSAKLYIESLNDVNRDIRNENCRINAVKANVAFVEKMATDPEFNEWFRIRQSAGWTDELRLERSQQMLQTNKNIIWGKNGEDSRSRHKKQQKVAYSYNILNFIIDCVKGKTTHQVTALDVTQMLNENESILNELIEVNSEKSIPNWEDKFTPNMVKKLPSDFGYDSWSDFRKKESLHNHRVVKIEKLADKIEVGTLTIDKNEKHHDYHTFALSCGIFTKNSNLGDIEDVVYFLKRLYKALNIPISRLEADSIVSLGRNTEINRDELKFGKFVTKVKKRFNMMFLDLLRTELILTKVITGKEWDKIKNQIKFVYSQDMYLEEQKKFEMMRDRLELLNELNDYVGKYFSHDYIRRQILKQSDEEIEEQDKLIEKEKTNKQYNSDEEEQGRF